MIPRHIILEKAADAAHAANPHLNLDQLKSQTIKGANEFEALFEPPAPKVDPKAPATPPAK